MVCCSVIIIRLRRVPGISAKKTVHNPFLLNTVGTSEGFLDNATLKDSMRKYGALMLKEFATAHIINTVKSVEKSPIKYLS